MMASEGWESGKEVGRKAGVRAATAVGAAFGFVGAGLGALVARFGKGKLLAFIMLCMVLLAAFAYDPPAEVERLTYARAEVTDEIRQEPDILPLTYARVEVTPLPMVAGVSASASAGAAAGEVMDWPYAEIFVREGARVDIPHKLLARWAWWESAMNPKAVSRDGYYSRGLGQFIYSTWMWVCKEKGYSYTWDDAFDPEINIKLMADYFDHCRSEAGAAGRSEAEIVKRMLAGYNAGPGYVKTHGPDAVSARMKRAIKDTMSFAGY